MEARSDRRWVVLGGELATSASPSVFPWLAKLNEGHKGRNARACCFALDWAPQSRCIFNEGKRGVPVSVLSLLQEVCFGAERVRGGTRRMRFLWPRLSRPDSEELQER